MSEAARHAIEQGETALGIELGSTRIKAVLIGPDQTPLAVGGHDWENQFVDRIWTYADADIWTGLQAAYAALNADVRARFGIDLVRPGALGISAMMHGYLAFDSDGALLVPFRTWRNTITGPASAELSEAFEYPIPQRWSVAHLYQAVLNGEEHLGRIAHLTTLAGYVHERLTGQRVLGVGDASGMFPIDTTTGGFNPAMMSRFDELSAAHGVSWTIGDLLPQVLPAGAPAGELSVEGAALLDPSGTLQAGVPCCPPEGDAGTGMVATNSVAPGTGNVSAGTSIFAMVVLPSPLRQRHEELDLVTTPAGDLVAMVHCNNGASELNSWAGVFAEFAARLGADADQGAVFETLFTSSLEAEADAGGLLAFNYLSGEHITGFDEGRPLIVRTPDSTLNLANLMRAELFATLTTLRLGMDILLVDEQVPLDALFAHGGLFKTRGVAQRYLAAALNAPVTVGEIAGEGGAWGIAVLAAYLRVASQLSLAEFLAREVFADATLETLAPDPDEVAGFNAYLARFRAALPVERAAVEST